ncbi:MAG TPA: xanthine dehydrogenase family protein molybdopterin-binding subunit [Acetobacteraceae bacterium]|nr:xanthine dehydrogenase family protein molybdopterin-binding subunit [Acetobacteraceae bacterium]
MSDVTLRQIGRSLPRVEARAKVAGTAEYIHNLRLPGMLYGKICRSTIPHGRIQRIDTTAAAAMPGIVRIVTGEDIRKIIPEPYYGPAFHDQPILALDKVRFAGEPVAVALAADPNLAELAAQAIVVEYDPLPAVFDEIEAVSTPVCVHDVLRPAGMFADLKHLVGRRDTNVALDFHLRRGDADAAFAASDRVIEHSFRTPQQMHVPLEPHVCVADASDGAVTIHSATQTPSFVRVEIARLLGWPENRVRVRTAFLGGGFGAKVYVKLEALAVALSLCAGRPVKLALTMTEQFFTISKHASTIRIKSAVTNDGRITARRCEVFYNGGAYADIGPRVAQKSGFSAAGPYDIANVAIDSYELYTNRPPAGALRGFGVPQLVWAYESHTDLIARALGLDPVAFRRKNLLRDGAAQATGTVMRDAGLVAVLDRIAARIGWDQPFDRGTGTIRRGRGVAIGFKASIAPTASVAHLAIAADGSATLYCGTVDMGQGSTTAMAQIAGETLGIAAEAVRVVAPDTDVTPYDMGTLGSRSTFHMGHAVRLAAEDARRKLAALAAEAGVPEGSNLPIPELFRRRYGMQAGTIMGSGSFTPSYVPPDPQTGLTPDATPYWMVGGSGAEVEVDTETGQMRVTRLLTVADAGTPVNPRIVETQISGAAVMQFGFTLLEAMEFTDGQLRNPSLADYKIPGIRDLPPRFETETVDAAQQNGPHGAKGVGESGTFGVSPAIANAIEDAVGVRIAELPITAEAVFRALRRAADDPLADA